MCGLIGLINKDWNATLPFRTEAVFRQLIYTNTLRGQDGTGVTKIKKDHSVETFKDNISGAAYLANYKGKNFINDYSKDSFAVFAHNRKATTGFINQETTQPFTEEHITLMHNGTLNYYNKTLNNNRVHSDSHYIALELAHNKKEIKTLEQFSGAYALIWHDAKKKHINLARNKERPLYIIEEESFFLIVSEFQMGVWILDRNGFKGEKITEVDPEYIYKYNYNSGKLHFSKHKFKNYVHKAQVTNVNIYNHNKSKLDVFDSEGDDDNYGSMWDFNKNKNNNNRITPIDNTYNSTKYPTLYTEEIKVIPKKVISVVTTHGGFKYYSGTGIKEDRYEITGEIVSPEKYKTKTFYTTLLKEDVTTSLLEKLCKAKYCYMLNEKEIKLSDLELILPPQPTPAVVTQTDDSTIFLKTLNGFPITEENFDGIFECKCAVCQSEPDFMSIEKSFVSAKTLQNSDVKYTYVCDACYPKYKKDVDSWDKPDVPDKSVPTLLLPKPKEISLRDKLKKTVLDKYKNISILH